MSAKQSRKRRGITWTKDSSTSTRVASVNVHYVDENGNDIASPTDTPAATIASGTGANDGKVTISDSWAKSITGYTYQEARLTSTTGTVITAMQANGSSTGNTTSYSLKYSVDGTTFTNVPKDAVTGSSNNSVDVYLIYQQNDHINVHFVDESGNEIASTVTKYLADFSDEINLQRDTKDTTWAQDISGYTYSSAHLKSSVGDTVAVIKGGEHLSVKYTSEDTNFSDTTTADLYLVYSKNNKSNTAINVYYTDIAGVPITDKSGNEIVKTYDPTEWENGRHSFIDDAVAYTPDGYEPFNKNQFNTGDDVPNWWYNSGKNKTDAVNSDNKILLMINQNIGLGRQVLRNGRGVQIDSATYTSTGSNPSLKFFRDDSGTSQNIAPGNTYNVYLLYKPIVHVYDLDNNNNQIGDTRNGGDINYYGANRWVNNNGTWTLDPNKSSWNSSLNSISGSSLINSAYNSNGISKIEVKRADGTVVKTITGSTEISNFKLTWQFDGPKNWLYGDNQQGIIQDSEETQRGYKWKTRIYTGTGETADTDYTEVDGLVRDVYITYNYDSPLEVTVHHVDSEGNKLAEDTTKSFESSDNVSLSINDFKSSITNYDSATVKFGTEFKSAQEFTSIEFTKNGDTWQYAIGNNTPSAIDGNAEVYVVYNEKTDGRAVTIHFVDENGNELIDKDGKEINPFVITSFVVSSDGKYTSGNNNGKYIYRDAWAGGNLTNRNDAKPYNTRATAAGYSFIGEYLGPNFNTDDNKKVNSDLAIVNSSAAKNAVQWYYDTNSSQWYTSHGANAGTSHNLTDSGVYKEYITDIYWVYTKKDSKNLTIHYIHPKYTTVNDKEIGSVNSNGNPEYELFSELSSTDHPVTINYDDVAAKGDDGLDLTTGSYASTISNSATYTYYGSFLASPISSSNQLPAYARLTTDGPHVKAVRIHDGKYQFLVVSGDGVNRPLSQTRRDQWSYVTTAGRTYTLRRGTDGNFSMLDSQAGRSLYPLSLTSTETSTNSSGHSVTTNTYTATSGTEGTGIVYSVREIITEGGSTTYDVTVHEWTDVNQHDIYQMYEKNTGSPNVVISNEVVYSGNLVARTTNLDANKIVSYEWQKSINDEPFETVVRKQNGNDWNIDHDLKDRSWLNLATDDGELSSKEGRKKVKYKVILTYSTGENSTATVESQEFNVPYWDQLENGSFETPEITTTDSNIQYSNTDNEPGTTGEYTKSYASRGGVWHTTGLGVDSTNAARGSQPGHDIEIVNTREGSNYKNDYSWHGTDGAKDGYQFAELNAETAGALYQDVVTHPNEYLNYWLSHRARGTNPNTTQYDSMYLVIMPTKLAMTSASDGGELKTQTDLVKFITNHAGSFASSNPGKLENEPVYRDNDSGVLIVKISSTNQGWHDISSTNGYIATSNLTRFFFVAAYTTATGGNTMGNFLDNVGFSQELQTPETPHYHMVVKKTFTGLSINQIAQLKDSFTLTINEFTKTGNTYTQKTSESEAADYFEPDDSDSSRHTSLNDAQLGFTLDDQGNLVLTATGRDPTNPFNGNRVNLLTNGSTGVVGEDPSTGSVTLTWTLYNNYFPTKGTNVTPEKYFTVTESGTDVNGYSVATTNDGTVANVISTTVDGVTTDTTTTTNLYEDSNGNATSSDGAKTTYFTIKNRSTARINYANSYRDNSNDDPDQIRIQKTFTGITPAVVNNLNGTADPFKITVKNSNNIPITLVGNVTNPVSGSYPAGVDSVNLETKANDDGSSTFTWTIIGTVEDSWINGTSYFVKEENYIPAENNPVTKITLNGKEATTKADGKVTWTESNGNTDGFRTVTVGENDDIPTITADTATQANEVVTKSDETTIPEATLNEKTNLIIAQYKLGENTDNHYLVWTPDIVGVNEEAAIKKVISAKFNDNNINDVSYRSGSNPGDIEISANEAEGAVKGKMTFNSETHKLSFTDSDSQSGAKWQSYYCIAASMTNPERVNEIRITNSYEPAVRVMKVSSGEDSKPLAGAEFNLYKYEDSTKKYLISNGSGLGWGESGAIKFTTGKDGIAVSDASGSTSLSIINGLKNGIYYLEETTAPPGYNMPAKNVVAIKVDENGVVSQITSEDDVSKLPAAEQSRINTNTNPDESITIDWNSPYYTITVRNKPGILLPITGGRGVYLFYIAGVLIVGIAGILIAKKKLNEKSM